ncbi:hypothetical protein SAV14893_079150 [Streptomyces avermitilis]|uniref:Uncharacterized protein n=1 Tax=Streptomyces avermitilis TaxID=33903 RepID=A0A4D4MGC5_STRAX|nr:hypothetical protein SAV14893_079150 [Streptomyces avermitilis]GDY71101.1 hypothetical protein SAV31267_005860 [Streptomyces avermitilis]
MVGPDAERVERGRHDDPALEPARQLTDAVRELADIATAVRCEILTVEVADAFRPRYVPPSGRDGQ